MQKTFFHLFVSRRSKFFKSQGSPNEDQDEKKGKYHNEWYIAISFQVVSLKFDILAQQIKSIGSLMIKRCVLEHLVMVLKIQNIHIDCGLSLNF